MKYHGPSAGHVHLPDFREVCLRARMEEAEFVLAPPMDIRQNKSV